jgi:hypothetical protein
MQTVHGRSSHHLRNRSAAGRQLKQFWPIPIHRKFNSTIIDHRKNGELRRCRAGLATVTDGSFISE